MFCFYVESKVAQNKVKQARKSLAKSSRKTNDKPASDKETTKTVATKSKTKVRRPVTFEIRFELLKLQIFIVLEFGQGET